VTKVSTPTAGQNALTNIAAATSNDLSASAVVLLDTTNAGTFPQIGEGSSVLAPAATLSKSESTNLSLSVALFIAIAFAAIII
jgi:hypothetical protein